MAAASTLMLSPLLFAAVICVGSGAAASGSTKMAPLDEVCELLGGYYVTPELCKSVLCHDASSPLAAANATVARTSVQQAVAAVASNNATEKAGLRSCLQLYNGFVAALEWAAGSVAAGRLPGAREVMQAAQHVHEACDGMAGEATPKESVEFFCMAYVVYAVLASVSNY
ncbi:unnamed protein product [Urochloa decumbens]|uniref:Pectinesterase inhibitor domain-containing protein n=1 Tax=Urochloa decumbens TaxID=240449 RepID=A0ABC9GDX3_9POAL